MVIKKAVITLASPSQRKLPLQTLIDKDGKGKSVLVIIIEETLQAGIDKIALIIHPGDENTYREVAGDYARHITFISQAEPLGYGHALLMAKDFVDNEAFLHLVGDHLYVSKSDKGCAWQLVQRAMKEECSISSVTPIRENAMFNYGVIGGKRVQGTSDLYKIDRVIEKPTPTEAEQRLFVPGLRAGHYLCFFGMHVFTSVIFGILSKRFVATKKGEKLNLSDTLNELAATEQYLAFEKNDWRYDVGTKYGLLKAQLALALSGQDKEQVLSDLLELLALRELKTTSK